jgi:molybdenum-dependent DNA-binding transcriptional regulator ModE
MLEGVTIEQLRTLRAVAEAGSFSAAARKLGRVQAAVSQAIDRLEAQLGLRLFDRTGRVPRLTAHGQAVVVAAAKVGAGVEALDELVESLKQGVERTLSIVVDVLFPTESLVAFAKGFAAEHPDVRLVLFTDVETWLHDEPTELEPVDVEPYLATICLGDHVEGQRPVNEPLDKLQSAHLLLSIGADSPICLAGDRAGIGILRCLLIITSQGLRP